MKPMAYITMGSIVVRIVENMQDEGKNCDN